MFRCVQAEAEEDQINTARKHPTHLSSLPTQIYEWGGDGYDGLGDRLDETGDDFNEDTFGVGDIGKDFDFGHGAAQQQAPQQQVRQKAPVDSMFASNMDDFWALPSFGKREQQQQREQPQFQQQQQQPLPLPAQQQQPVAAPSPQPPARTGKTMEEIEAELRAASLAQQQPATAPPPSQPARRPLTMEEVEAQMRAGGAPPPPPATSDANFPPLGATPDPTPSAAQPLAPPPPPPGMLPFPPPPPQPPLAAMHPAQQAEHFARMQAMLRALPDAVQQGITALPPHMHFDVLQGVCREFPILLEPPNSALQQRQQMAQDAALGRLAMIAHHDRKRHIREAKIAAMARHNNVMTVSDKEFITRIQISQIITADPYADDFYAHIYFALRGRPIGPNPGLMGNAPQQPLPPTGPAATNGNGNNHDGRAGKASRNKQPKMNAQQKAMLRMQQQVERLVADRKQRIEKAATGTANPNLAGALGKVGINVAGNPRQALQIGNDKVTGSEGTTGGITAADAVKQALAGASLDVGGADSQMSTEDKRPPLTRHETLRILERLYDIVLNLEHIRRAGGGADEEEDEATELTAAMWKELRVLEPLEISDPHPFVSLLGTIKGKRLVPRVLRSLSHEQTLTTLTMIVASFDSLDVVREAHYLDDVSSLIPGAGAAADPERKRQAEAQAEAFSHCVVPAMLQHMSNSPMRIVIGMLALFVERNDVVKAVRSRAGISFLTILLSRAEALRQTKAPDAPDAAAGATADAAAPTPDEQTQWASIFQLLFERLVTGSGGLNNLFPSSRAKANMPFGISYYLMQGGAATAQLQSTLDDLDKDVWNLYAALAVSSTIDQQSILVQELREKILENVLEARGKSDSLEGQRKLRLVNIFLNALNLDASQITV